MADWPTGVMCSLTQRPTISIQVHGLQQLVDVLSCPIREDRPQCLTQLTTLYRLVTICVKLLANLDSPCMLLICETSSAIAHVGTITCAKSPPSAAWGNPRWGGLLQ
jgi:hypothetical protein